MGDRETVRSHNHHRHFGAQASPTPYASLMKRSIAISGKIEPFFGTLDENVRLLEDSLHVRTHLHDSKLTIEGTHDAVERAVKIVEEYNHATRNGRHLSGEEVKSLMRISLDEPHSTASEVFEHGKSRSFGRSKSRPKTPPKSTTWSRLSRTTWSSASARAAPARPISPSPWRSARFSRSKSTASSSLVLPSKPEKNSASFPALSRKKLTRTCARFTMPSMK